MPVLLLKFLLFYGENRLIMPDNQKKIGKLNTSNWKKIKKKKYKCLDKYNWEGKTKNNQLII